MLDRKTKQKLNDIAKRYDGDMLACRDHGHSWKPTEASWLQDGNIERVLSCERCGAKRVQILDKYGYIIKGHYTYATGYQFRGLGRMTVDAKAILRKTNVLRTLQKK